MTSTLESKGSCIDNNHSHFLLVDDGTDGKYGGEIAFRARLQNCLAGKEVPRGLKYTYIRASLCFVLSFFLSLGKARKIKRFRNHAVATSEFHNSDWVGLNLSATSSLARVCGIRISSSIIFFLQYDLN